MPAVPPVHYQYSVVGNRADAVSHPVPGAQLEGGGTDQDAAFQWLAEHAQGGDVLVLRASGGDAYNPYIQGLGHVNSVATLVLDDRQASYDPFVLDRVRHAEAIFIAGGDQDRYYRQWRDTPLQQALNAALASGVPVGGTSAGLAILGNPLFPAEGGTITSAEALTNPSDPRLHLEAGLFDIPALKGVVTDTHFHQRDRMGRLLTFIEEAQREGRTCDRGLGVDEKTAVLADADGTAHLVGQGHAYFVRRVSDTDDFDVFRMDGASTFNLRTWQGYGGTRYTLTLHDGHLQTSGAAVY